MAWEVALNGDVDDLALLAESFTDPDYGIVRRANEYFMTGTAFDGLPGAQEVRDRAMTVVTCMSGAAKLELGSVRALEIGHVARVGASGPEQIYVFPEPATVVLSAGPVGFTLTRADGSVKVHRPADAAAAAFRVAVRNEHMQKALRLWNQPKLEWVELYRIFEVIEAESGATQDSMRERFKWTANSVSASGDLARHGTPSTGSPRSLRPMSLAQGREFVARLLRHWIVQEEMPT